MPKPLFPSLFSILCFCIHSVAQQPLMPDEKFTSQIKHFNAEYIAGMKNVKLSVPGSYFANDIRLMPEFQKTVMGKRNALAYYTAFSERFEILHYDRQATEILDLGTQISEAGKFSAKIKCRDSVHAYDLTGKYLNVWKKSNDQLTLQSEAWNYDTPLVFENLLRFDVLSVADVALMPHLPVNNNIRFELAALNSLMEKAVNDHDAALWLQFYSKDGEFFYSRNKAYRGEKELAAFLDNHCKHLPVFEKLDIRNDRVDQSGNYVIEYASHIAVWRDGDYSGVALGKDLRIWKRQTDGSLKIFRHIGMYD